MTADRKLTARVNPYSSTVGGGLTLSDGIRPAFMVLFCGTTAGITKEETAALSAQFKAWVDAHGLTVPQRTE
jgi:hypothetical protein